MKNYLYYLQTLEKTLQNECYVSTEELFSIINLPGVGYGMNDITEIKAYFHQKANWICTDTKVGLRFYFLNNEFIACSYQFARKSDRIFEFASKEAYKKLFYFLLSKIKLDDSSISCLDEAEDWSEFERKP